jgi:hypothetical protein
VPFKDYNELVEPLELPINGKVYRIPPVGFDEGITLAEGLDPKNKATLTDEIALPLVLGSALEEMRADHVRPAAITRAFMAALADWKRDRATAEIMWETGGDPKAIRAVANPTATTPTAAAAETTTPRRASTSGTSLKPSSK